MPFFLSRVFNFIFFIDFRFNYSLFSFSPFIHCLLKYTVADQLNKMSRFNKLTCLRRKKHDPFIGVKRRCK